VFSADWELDADRLVFTVSANAYLYHMVRRMVRLQVEIGQGKQTLELLEGSLLGDKSEMAQGLAPAHGLYLTHVRYPPDSGMD
jgi:tRNA pseudouridine38-40 synthase